jgi:hypothetical protein
MQAQNNETQLQLQVRNRIAGAEDIMRKAGAVWPWSYKREGVFGVEPGVFLRIR